jgi:hypothetical protein
LGLLLALDGLDPATALLDGGTWFEFDTAPSLDVFEVDTVTSAILGILT